MWFSVVCTLIDNGTRHHSGQNCCGLTRRTLSIRVHMQMRSSYASDFSCHKLCQTPQHEETMQKINVREKSNNEYSLSIRVQTTLNHFSICFFLPQYHRQLKIFFKSAS